MLFGASLSQLALFFLAKTSGQSVGPRPDRERVLEKSRMPKLAAHWSPTWM
jgi:hypothetical protein